ncbi:cinnamoyl-CoA reductase 1-like [Cornus florida]|uniref:cinnamoyl-CoA reductase 1-like n=1 Tax=Cornus florida TaxID=4283 RepID=UPI002899A910|nr:cinnamoyl-CoA reductase 1-like [Cornus florida]
MSGKEGEVVCVTGGSGYIGSWLVRLLLERGYTVHATVKDLKDEKETKHIEALEGAQSRLHLFQIDLLHYDSIVAAVAGANGVFHLASPCIVDQVHDPEKELLDPAIKETNNVLNAAKELGVRRVVVTSSVSAITPSWYWPADVVKDENCWTDIDYCKTKGVSLLRFLRCCTQIYEDVFMGSDHVKHVALAHILVYENTSATASHLCVEAISHYGDFAAKVAELCPEYKVPS